MSTPRIYVGTYAKYNNGSIQGAWIDLDGHDEASFAEACAELHKDEADPELMYQDCEGFPTGLYHESSIDPRIWDYIELSEHEREIFAAYLEDVDQTGTPKQAEEAYAGHADSEAAWAESFLDETGTLNEVPESLRSYIDFEAYARDAGVTFARVDDGFIVFYQ